MRRPAAKQLAMRIAVAVAGLMVALALHPTAVPAAGQSVAEPVVATAQAPTAAGPDEAPSAQQVYNFTDTLSGWYRYLDTPGHHAAEAFINQTLRGYGLTVYDQEFTVDQAGQPLDAVNVVGYLEGEQADEWLVLGGHYDATIGSVSAAYDNGVGTATVLELARYFTQVATVKPRVSLVFAAWDAEEEGGRGSAHFVERLDPNVTVVANLNFDMFGLSYPVPNPDQDPWGLLCDEDYYRLYVYTSPVEDFSAYQDYEYDEATRANFTTLREIVEAVSHEQLALPPEWVPVVDDTEANSDQRSFIRAGLPAVWFRGMHENAWEEGDGCEQTIKHYPTDQLESLVLIAGSHANLLAGFQTALDIAVGLVDGMAYAQAVLPEADETGLLARLTESEVGLAIGAVGVVLVAVAVFVAWKGRPR